MARTPLQRIEELFHQAADMEPGARARFLEIECAGFLARAPIGAHRVGVTEGVWRWCRRRPLVAAFTAASTLLGIALLVTVVVYQSLLLKHTKQELQGAQKQVVEKGQLAEDERRKLSTLDRTLGARELEQGDAFTALLWLTEALRVDSVDPDQESKDRIAIALALQQCPRLAQFLIFDRHVVGVQLTASGCWLATRGENGTLKIWDVMTGRVRVLNGAVKSDSDADSVALSADGRFLAVAESNGSIRVWEVTKGQPHTPSLGHGARVLRATFSDDNGFLVTYLADGRFQTWNLRTGQQVLWEGAEPGPARRTAVSDNGRWFFTLSEDGVGRVRQIPHGNTVAGLVKIGHAEALAAVSADGRRLALIDAENALWVWDPHTGKETLLVPSLHSEGVVRQLRWSPDGRLLLTVSNLNQARVWDALTGSPVTPPLPHAGPLLSAGFAGNDQIVMVGREGCVRIWQLRRAQEETAGIDVQAAPEVEAQTAAVPRPIQLADGTTVRAKEHLTSTSLQPPRPHENIVEHAAFSPDGSRVVTIGEDLAVRVWDCATGTQRGPALPHRDNVFYAAFSPDGRRLVTATANRMVHLWDVATAERIAGPLKSVREIERLTFSADGRTVAITLKGGLRNTLDLNPEKRSLTELISLAQVLSGRRFDTDGTLLPLEVERLQADWKSLQP